MRRAHVDLRSRIVIAIATASAAIVVACVGDEPSPGSVAGADAATADGALQDAAPVDAALESGNPCDAGSSFCSGTCIDTISDPLHCGGCTACNGGDLGAEVEGGVPPVDCENSGCLIRYGNLTRFPQDSMDGNNVLLAYHVTIASAGAVQRLGVYSVAAGGKIQMALYDATGTGGEPNNLIASTFAVSLMAAPMELATTTQPTVASGSYWVVMVFDTTSSAIFQSATSEHNYYTSGLSGSFTFGTAFPAMFPTPMLETNGLDPNIYAVIN
jgi:hypothetical protein